MGRGEIDPGNARTLLVVRQARKDTGLGHVLHEIAEAMPKRWTVHGFGLSTPESTH